VAKYDSATIVAFSAFEISAISLEKFSSKVKNSDVKIKGQIKMADEIDSDNMSDDFMQLFADSGDEDE
jgi:hypothetical protein